MKVAKKFSQKIVVFRNFIFGVEDSLVSTVGLLSGVASSGASKQTIFVTGTVLIFVEAISMAIGSFLTENSVEEYEKNNDSFKGAFKGGTVMFASYFVAGFVPLTPYIFYEKDIAFSYSITLSLISLFCLGFVSALILRANPLKKAIQMGLLGGVAILVGISVGKIIGN